MFDATFSDIRYAARALRAAPGFTATAVTLLALSIGALTTVFSGIDAALLRSLPGVPRPDAIVWVTSQSRLRAQPAGLSYPEIADLRAARRFEALASFEVHAVNLGSGDEPRRLRAHIVDGDYFTLLGARPHTGRFFGPDELRAGTGHRTTVLGYQIWRDAFGADPEIIGRTIQLNNAAFVVVGVAQPSFAGPALGEAADLWLPLGAAQIAYPAIAAALQQREQRSARVLARLPQGASFERASAFLTSFTHGLAQEHPAAYQDVTLRVATFKGALAPESRAETSLIAILMVAIAGLVLLIACLNIGNLLLARGLRRSQETSIRLALGAARWRLVRQFLTESVLLAMLGAAGGIAVSALTGALLRSTIAGAASLDMTLNARMLVFVLAATIGTVLVFGVAPALYAAQAGANAGMNARMIGATRKEGRLQRGFLVAQLAISLVVLVAASQFIVALRKSSRIELGFDSRGVALLSFDLALQNYSRERQIQFEREVQNRLSTLPGVQQVGLADAAPLSGMLMLTELETTGGALRVGYNSVNGEFFQALRIPMAKGRTFSGADRSGAPLVAIVNETAAQRLWPGANAVGKTVRLAGTQETLEVIGVVRDAKYDEPAEDPLPFVFVPRAQHESRGKTVVMARGAGAVPPSIERLQEAIQQIDPALPVFDRTTMSALIGERLDRQIAIARMLSIFGFVGLLIAAVGLYGLISFTVSRRTREFGVRLALGASPSGVRRMVVRAGARLALTGVAIGAVLAVPLMVVLSSAVFGVDVTDIAGSMMAAAVLIGAALLASYLPARAASLTSPSAALRAQ